jgi:hypothetical protein
MYLGISASKFDELRKASRICPARIIGGRKVWDIRALDEIFESFPLENVPDEDWTTAV